MPKRSAPFRSLIAAVVAGVIAAAALPATLARADSVSPLTSYGGMVVAGDHVFISGGTQSSSILVTDLDGNAVTTITNEPGPFGLAVSPDGNTVYVALAGADAISAISATSLAETARYSTSGMRPAFVATAGGKVWFSYSGTYGGAAGIGSVDPSVSPAVVALKQTQDTWSGPPALATPSAHPGMLAAAQLNVSSLEAAVYDVSASPAVTVVHKTLTTPQGADDLAVTPDGADLVLASSFPYVHQLLRTSDLSPDGSYPTKAYPDAVAIAPDGTVAAGVASGYGTSVYVFAPHASLPLNTYDYSAPISGNSATLVPAGLAWSPDGHRLFAVTEVPAAGTETLRLHVLVDPEIAASHLTLKAASATVLPGQTVTLAGTLNSGTPIAAGTTVHVVRALAGAPTTPLPDAVTGSDGSFTITDTPAEGDYTYGVSYDGDATHKASNAAVEVKVAKAASILGLTYPPSASRGAQLTITGRLANPAYAAGEVVQVTRSDQGSPTGAALGAARVNADGSFTVTDTPEIGGTVTYSASYAGDQTHTPSAAHATVAVSRASTALSIVTDGGSYTYGSWAKATVHLGTTFNNRDVTVSAMDAVGNVIGTRTGPVDFQGNLTVYLRPAGTTTFTASFSGDYQYAPATANTTVQVHATLNEAQSGYYATVHYGQTLYRVYHHTRRPVLAVAVAPNKGGECVVFRLQEYLRGAWRPFHDSTCFALNSRSATGVALVLNGTAVGHLFRLDAVYRGDSTNLGAYGAWQYFTVRR